MNITNFLPILIPSVFFQVFLQVTFINHAYNNPHFSSKMKIFWIILILLSNSFGVSIYLIFAYKKAVQYDSLKSEIHPYLQQLIFVFLTLLFQIYALQHLHQYEGNYIWLLSILFGLYFLTIIINQILYVYKKTLWISLFSLLVLMFAYGVELIKDFEYIQLFSIIGFVTVLNNLSNKQTKTFIPIIAGSFMVITVINAWFFNPLDTVDEVIVTLYLNTLIGLLLIFAFYGFKRQIETSYKYSELSKVLLEQSKTIEAMSIFEERQRITSSIHDHVGHTLTTAIISIEAGEKQLSKSPEKALEYFTLAKNQVKKGMNDIRHLVKQESNYQSESFQAKIESIIQMIHESSDITINFIFEVTCEMIPIYESILLQSLKELMTNSIKHGNAKTIDILVQNTNQFISLSVTDDGLGSDKVTLGFGLSKMQDTVKNLGGAFHITTTKLEGFSVTLSLPLGGIKHEN